MRKNAQQPFGHVDMVHVEVAVTGDRELYSWPGANKFEDRDITDMINSGTVSNGDFASALRSVITNNVSIITWHSYEEQFGRFNDLCAAKRQTIRWDYRIPYNLSGWILRYGGRQGRVPEAGSFWADAESLDVLRLEVNAEEIPPDIPLTAVKNTLEYARVRFGSQVLLIPQSAELMVTELTGQQRRNVMEFSHCREFAAQTTLSFNEPANITDNPAMRVEEITFPAGLRLSVRLTHTVDSETAAVGDPISATVESDVKLKGKLLVPQGAILRGRIRQLDAHTIPREYHVVGLEFTDLEFPGHHGRFFGEMEEGIVAHNALAFTYCVRSGCTTCLIRPCAPLEPIIQDRFTRGEPFNMMIATQRFRRRDSHGLLPGCAGLHALDEAFVGSRRSIQTCQELAIRLRTHREYCAVQQRVLSGATSRVQDKIGAVLAGDLRGPIDQFAYLRLDADVERLAPGSLSIRNTHRTSSIAVCNDVVFTFGGKAAPAPHLLKCLLNANRWCW
jgi:hypothetical protein